MCGRSANVTRLQAASQAGSPAFAVAVRTEVVLAGTPSGALPAALAPQFWIRNANCFGAE